MNLGEKKSTSMRKYLGEFEDIDIFLKKIRELAHLIFKFEISNAHCYFSQALALAVAVCHRHCQKNWAAARSKTKNEIPIFTFFH